MTISQSTATIWIPWLPLVAALLCGVCTFRAGWRKHAGKLCVMGLAGSLGLSVWVARGEPMGEVARAFEWIHVGSFMADFGYFVDPLTSVMMLVVTGVGTLVAIYATGYMKGDPGEGRFFFAVGLFIFSMLTVAMADNLLLLYLGWEMVGLCSYLLIGHYFDKPSAVAAAKKAFIVNRIGDLGFALGIFCVYMVFGSVRYVDIIPAAQAMLGQISPQELTGGALAAFERASSLGASQGMIQIAPYLLMMGALGKSAQLPLYVWLPDAMEGPTPVSALIHAATMVTSGVYMIARLLPIFELSPHALEVVAIIGGCTAVFGATVALTQYDIKRVFAFSTVSQLGYMFLGVGAYATHAGIFHLVSHAFFKALLFLTAGSVMHAMAGQLDLRKMSGLRHKMPVTCLLMLAGALALAGFPFTSGFFSKDEILAAALGRGLHEHLTLYTVLALMGFATALLTACYAFRVWFRLFMGPERYEMGHDHHHDEHAGAHHGPHEMPWRMNAPLVLLAVGALLGGVLLKSPISHAIEHSTAQPYLPVTPGAHGAAHGETHAEGAEGMDVHTLAMIVSAVISISGISLAAYFHALRRPAADRLKAMLAPLHAAAHHQWYVDAAYNRFVRGGLLGLAHVLRVLDDHLINNAAMAIAFIPRAMGLSVRPLQRGSLQGYGLTMIGGAALIALVLLLATAL